VRMRIYQSGGRIDRRGIPASMGKGEMNGLKKKTKLECWMALSKNLFEEKGTIVKINNKPGAGGGRDQTAKDMEFHRKGENIVRKGGTKRDAKRDHKAVLKRKSKPKKSMLPNRRWVKLMHRPGDTDETDPAQRNGQGKKIHLRGIGFIRQPLGDGGRRQGIMFGERSARTRSMRNAKGG